MTKCTLKRQFPTLCEAIQAADKYMDEIALVLAPMTPYRCNKHNCYHIGHNRYMNYDTMDVYSTASRARGKAIRQKSDIGRYVYDVSDIIEPMTGDRAVTNIASV